jgi:hypothetical protein
MGDRLKSDWYQLAIEINCVSCQIKMKCDHHSIVIRVQMLAVTDHVSYVVSQNKLTAISLALTVVLKGRKESKRGHMSDRWMR